MTLIQAVRFAAYTINIHKCCPSYKKGQVVRVKSQIGYLLKGYPRLSETFILNEIYLLEQQGFQIQIYALRNPQDLHNHPIVDRINAPVQYISDYPLREWKSFLAANLRLLICKPKTYLRTCGFAIKRSVHQRDSATFKRFVQAVFLVQEHLENKPLAHLHAHFANDPTTIAFFVNWLIGLPFSFTAHAKDIYTEDSKFLHQKIAGAQFVITCTGYNRQYLKALSRQKTLVLGIYHGINLQTFSPATRTRQEHAALILSVGRLVPKKGFLILLESLRQLQERGLEFRCHIIGAGPQQIILQERISQLGLAGQVRLLGKMTQSELRRAYATADIMALACQVTSDGDRDGIPNVLVEAMATGTPVVSTRISGIPELIENGVNGLLVPEKEPQALALALEQLILNPEMAETLALAARRIVEQKFNANANAQRVARLFNEQIDESIREKYSPLHHLSSALDMKLVELESQYEQPDRS